MSLALAHSSVTQANRYWSLGVKYTGHNGHFLTYLNELIKEVEFQMNTDKRVRDHMKSESEHLHISVESKKKKNYLLVKKYETTRR